MLKLEIRISHDPLAGLAMGSRSGRPLICGTGQSTGCISVVSKNKKKVENNVRNRIAFFFLEKVTAFRWRHHSSVCTNRKKPRRKHCCMLL